MPAGHDPQAPYPTGAGTDWGPEENWVALIQAWTGDHAQTKRRGHQNSPGAAPSRQ